MSSRKPVIVVDEEDNFADGTDLNFKTDEELALLLQNQENERLYTNIEDLIDDSSNSELIADAADDLIEELDPEPFPDIRDLFIAYNAKYFKQSLNSVEVKWSPKMTLCAGLCCYERGGYCVIKMSEPILKYRTKKDLVDTLLHEMIHAYLFVTRNNKDRDGHGPEFTKLMNEINKSGHNITVFHNFHDEVNLYRNHWWQCDKCKNIVKRAMNRAPSPHDPWWPAHEKKCGGKYVKIKEPEDYGKKKGKKRKRKDEDDSDYKEEEKITKFFKKDNGDKIKAEPKENNNSENKINENNNIKREISASQELKISRDDVSEDKISGPSLPNNFPKIEFDSDIEEQELIRKPSKKKGISSLANSTDSLMNISGDSLTNTNKTNSINSSSNDVTMKDEYIGFDVNEEERRIQRDILAEAALKRLNSNNNSNVKIEPKNHNINITNSNSNNHNVQLNKTAVIPKKEKILTEECPICSKKVSGTEVEITIHVEKCLSGETTTPERPNNDTKIKDEPSSRHRQQQDVKFQLGDNLVVDDDVVVLD